ncbi:9693_t:CDS:2 [Dentiscutata heterogama]|uniref:9693_t:CDS:1 n=1 Tax=Dentiscutata heterogama TaxID=1316150 RepID=A0ACA9PEZ0_9GLOM|nr:9693_t:CDS:2 [Dentiscutata heterogama]
MQNAVRRVKRAREVGRKIQAIKIIQQKWLEYFYRPEDPLENLSYNYNNKASVKTHIDMINQESQTQDTIPICSCNQTHRCFCFVCEDEINHRVKKEVNVLFQRLLEYNEKTFDKFMREINIEHKKRVNENKKL